MPKRLGSDEIIRVLREHGFFLVTQRGSHAKNNNPAGRVAIVPHPKKELRIGTTSEALLDVNVLIAAHLTNHADHPKARQFVTFGPPPRELTTALAV